MNWEAIKEDIENDILMVIKLCYSYVQDRTHRVAISLTETLINHHCQKASTLKELQRKEDTLRRFVFEQQRMRFWTSLDEDQKQIELITFKTNQQRVSKGLELVLSTITEPVTRTACEAVWKLSKWLKVSLLFNVWAAFAEIRRNLMVSRYSVGIAEFRDISQGVNISKALEIMRAKPLE